VDVPLEHNGSPQSKRIGDREHTEPKDKKSRHSYKKEARSQISDTQANRWQEHLDKVYGTVEVQRNRRNVKRSSNAQTAEETAAELSAVSNTGPDTRHVRYAGQHKMILGENSKTLANGIQKSWNFNHSL
jgi:hypothetical protein